MNRTILILAVTLALTAPAAASWSSHGEKEPDTDFDVLSGRTFENPDVDSNPLVRKVYFNTFQNEYLTGVNPNSGTTGSRILAPFLLHFQAVVGVWKDCNNDGYVGTAESAFISYRSELLLEKTICPDNTPHNDGKWVHEFFHVAPWNDPDNNTRTPNLIPNNDTRVWGDLGAPGFMPGQSCPLLPPPHGASSSTGAAIRYADCLANFKISAATNATAPLDGTGGLQFSFTDSDYKNPQNSDSVLNQDAPESVFGNPFYDDSADGKETGALQKDLYEERQDEYAFTVFDCSGDRYVDVHDDGVTAAGQSTGASDGQRDGPLVGGETEHYEIGTSQIIVRDPTVKNGKGQLEPAFGTDNVFYANTTDDSGSFAWTADFVPVVGSPTWSFAAALNHTTDSVFIGATQLYSDEDDEQNSGDCKAENGNAYNGAHSLAFFYADGRQSAHEDHEGTAQAAGKNKANMLFGFYDGVQAAKQLRDVLGENTPRDAGLQTGLGTGRPDWGANVIWVTDPQVVSPDTVSPSGRAYWTFYAALTPQDGSADNVTALGLTLPNPQAATYGSDNCDTIGTGAPIQKGWVCDPDLWYIDASGIDQDPDNERPVPGWSYQLRDVDCHDGELVQGSDIRASLIGYDTAGVLADNPACVGPEDI